MTREQNAIGVEGVGRNAAGEVGEKRPGEQSLFDVALTGAALGTVASRARVRGTALDAPAGTTGGGHHLRDAGAHRPRGGGHRPTRAKVIGGARHPQGCGANDRDAISAGRADPRGRDVGAARGGGAHEGADGGRSDDCLHRVRPDGSERARRRRVPGRRNSRRFEPCRAGETPTRQQRNRTFSHDEQLGSGQFWINRKAKCFYRFDGWC